MPHSLQTGSDLLNIGAILASDPAPLLLKIPPFFRHDLILGKTELPWSKIMPGSRNVISDPTLKSLVQAQVGGEFWAPNAAVSRRSIVIPPTDTQHTAKLWAAAKQGRSAADLVLVLPDRSRHWRSLHARVLQDGGKIISSPVNPWSLLRSGQEIITYGDDIQSISALGSLAGLPIWRLDGTAIWPDSEDITTHERTAELLLHATRYRSPFTNEPIKAKDAVDLLIHWRDIIHQNRKVAVCAGMAWWKRARISDFFATADAHRPAPFFSRRAKTTVKLAQRHSGSIAVWSTRMPRTLKHCARNANIEIHQVEDGFIRSAGLGSGMLPPASIIVDTAGIYYDPSKPSDLEILLSSHPLGDDLQTRARHLMDRMIMEGVSKYARGGAKPKFEASKGKRTILVPGQVSDDLSVLLGGAGLGGNLELLHRTRMSEPDAFIIYRPHPDVDAGHRAGAIPDSEVLKFADQIYRGGGMAPLLEAIDEVHTLTSLAGFEALMRRKPVTTYGQPFYASWGLTQDHAPIARRTRHLTIEQLAAATLLLYPRYIDPLTRLPCEPEIVVSRFGMTELWRPNFLMRIRRYQGACIKTLRKGTQRVYRRLSSDRVFD